VVTMIALQTLSLVKSPSATLPPESNQRLASVLACIHFVLWLVLVNLIPGPRSSDTPESAQLPRSSAGWH